MIHRLLWTWIALLALTLGDTAQVTAQVQLASRAPRFVRISPVTRRLVDASHATILKREMSLSLDRSSLAEALDEISRTAGINLIYSRDLVPLETPVTLQAATISLGAALTAVLFDTGLDVVISSNGEMALMKKAPISPLARAPSGSVSGQVTDARTRAALAGAEVVVDRTSLGATTDDEGRYRITEVAPGRYKVLVRYIGYAPGTALVTVTADQETTADFTLERSAQQLNELVTTGTVVPTEVRAISTPVSVIDRADIELRRPRTVQEVLRQGVPTAVGWEQPNNPYLTAFSARGASTLLSGGVGQMKVFVDGIETALTSASAVDPSSIERIEVVRGPQAASIYGSDAIGGVVAIFTRRGDSTLTRPVVNAEAALGNAQTPYAGFGGVLRQNYKGSVYGGGANVTYNVGGGYSHTGDYLPNGEQSAQSLQSAYGGIQYNRGLVTLDISGRYYSQNLPAVLNPVLAQTGLGFASKPFFMPQNIQNQSAGLRLTVAPAPWWQHTVRVGIDRFALDEAQSQPRLTTPGDTLLQVINQSETKTSLSYSTSLQGTLSNHFAGSLTAGIDHWRFPVDQFFAFGAANTIGTLRAPAGAISVSRTITTNTGEFVQGQLGFRNVLFLTAGLRAEQNSDFGDSLSSPISPRVGLSYVQDLGSAAIKFRGSFGRAIRAPAPGLKLGTSGGVTVTLANPNLGPERQKGWDAGIDAVFGQGSLSVTYYDQAAEDLIQSVQLPSDSVPTRQRQNIGRVKNRGVEVEATLQMGPASLRGQYGFARSRIDRLAPGYTGDLRVNDQALVTPKHTAGASVTVTPYRTTVVTVGITYVGSWNNYDYIEQFSCFGSTGPCQPSNRDYIREYPGFVKANAAVFQQITPAVQGFVSVDNLSNEEAYELDNLSPVMGRVTNVGLRLHY